MHNPLLDPSEFLYNIYKKNSFNYDKIVRDHIQLTIEEKIIWKNTAQDFLKQLLDYMEENTTKEDFETDENIGVEVIKSIVEKKIESEPDLDSKTESEIQSDPEIEIEKIS